MPTYRFTRSFHTFNNILNIIYHHYFIILFHNFILNYALTLGALIELFIAIEIILNQS